ncbi:MAG: histidine phosphatase family protein [Planctomycetaceae bacterium]|nr:histidine phosphatase family protein [Planctomycetaceae bacterium]
MKTLLLLRHAKSSWKDADLDDHDRPLNKRGKREAPRMGQLLKDENLLPDFLVASTARRARKTVEHVIQHSGYRGETRITGELYEARQHELLAFVSELPDTAKRVLLVGHNPGLEELLEALTGQCVALTTAALAQVESPARSWKQFREEGHAQLVKVWQPRELE